MLTIKCAKCNKKIMKYKKVGQGRVLRCYTAGIKDLYAERCNDELKCKCGNSIGIFEADYIKMRQHSFIYSGTKIKK